MPAVFRQEVVSPRAKKTRGRSRPVAQTQLAFLQELDPHAGSRDEKQLGAVKRPGELAQRCRPQMHTMSASPTCGGRASPRYPQSY